ncbi:MAG: beta-ketoacyl-[acyl-carrier-protein] synthase II, partial [Proteobacteria bacterium]|nr:beta-ketoacyl-[acyl-carrier-protein] synthase II [Pseudomonadota bacterium]
MKPVYLNHLGMVTALGNASSTLAGLRELSTDGLRWRNDLRNTPAHVAQVDTVLPDREQWPLACRSRNNQLLAAAMAEISDALAALFERHGADRVGAVIGSSTSGILEGGDALATRFKEGAFPAHFDYAQQEIGAPASFIRRIGGVR